METILYMIIPCYNEEKVLPVTAGQFLEELKLLIRSGKVSGRSRILFVDDGSSDRTWKLIRSFAEADRHYAGIRQSRNRGHQNAVLAGLMEARAYADITISIDCDGQDDISAMEEMVDHTITDMKLYMGYAIKGIRIPGSNGSQRKGFTNFYS